MSKTTNRGPEPVVFEDPPVARALLAEPRFAWLWLVLRVWLGWHWLEAGWGKLQNPAWMETGAALRSFWERAIQTDPRPVVTYDWYRAFLQFLLETHSYTWFARVIAVGEVLVGIALILGLLTGIAAFFGSFMNFNFMLAGTVSTNPVMFAVATWLVLAWKTAGWIGLDRWVLPLLGTPWQPGALFKRAGPQLIRAEQTGLRR